MANGNDKKNARMKKQEECVMDTKKFDYTELIDMDCKNQTAKLLENYFHRMLNEEEYDSVIPIEKEHFQKTFPEYLENINKKENKNIVNQTVQYVKHFILNVPTGNDFDIEEFKRYLCNLDYLVDKVLAFNIAILLNKKDVFVSEFDFETAWMSCTINPQKEYIQETDSKEDTPVDTSKLTIGMTVKNYKILCELLGQEIKEGNSRKYQLKNFERYFAWEKAGQKFTIMDIYDSPLEKEDLRKLGNNSIYTQAIEVILLQYLSHQDGYTRTLTKKKWWELLGITNHKYGRMTEKELLQLDKILTSFEIRHFYQRCNKKLEQILFSALNNLKNRKLINYQIQTVIVTTDEETGKDKYFLATDDNLKSILEVERYVLHDVLGFEKIFQVFLRFKQKEYYQKINEIIYEKYGWNYYFKQVKIIYVQENVQKALPESELNLKKQFLNKKVVSFLNENAENEFKKQKEKYSAKYEELVNKWWGNPEDIPDSEKSELWKMPDVYVTAQKILTDELIKIGHKDLSFSVKEFIESNSDLDEMFLFCNK